ncbi:MAG: HAD family phosphatase [Actinomycetota bacterium]|nr:HAD family phosphatase [Actinomycetota bacterium]
MSAAPHRRRAVICDFGGVLTNPLAEAFVAWQEASGVSLEELGRAVAEATGAAGGRHPLHELETGRIDEAQFLARIEAALGREGSLASFADVYFGALRRNPEMIEFMRRLRGRGLRMALLTNNVREWEPRWRAMLPEIDDIFEVVVDSAFVGVRKPDPEIYRVTLERLGGGVRAEDCVFVDDVEPNCEAASELGMRAVHFTESREAIAAIEAALR